MFRSLQAGRGLAALMVVFYHLNVGIFGEPKYWAKPAWAGFSMGHAGVYFFFVLSGFIIAWRHWREAGDKNRLGNFAIKRTLRIYPAYWVVLLAILPIYFFNSSYGEGYEREPSAILTSFLLLPNTHPPILTVAWTLCHEMLFYLLFTALFFHLRAGIAVMGLWFAGCLVQMFMQSEVFPLTFLFAPINLLFLLGMLTAGIIKHGSVPAAPVFAVAGVLVFGLAGVLDVQEQMNRDRLTILFGLGSMLAVLGAVELERRGKLYVPDALVKLGDASYSLYLVHFTVLSICAKVYFAIGGGHLPAAVGFFAILIPTVASGFAYHWAIERPLNALLSRCSSKASSSTGPYRATSRIP